MLHRFPTGLAGEKVHQKRLPAGAPDWVETVRLHFPRWNRTADELCVTELGAVIWAVQMSTVEFHPWNSRREDPEKPDEWRIDLDPGPLSDFAQVQRVAGVAHEILDELGAVGYPKTSGGKGLHIYVRIRPDHGHKEVRRAALAFAREVERRMPDDVTTLWWRKDRDPHHLFVDYNQNARDHTIAAAYSVRGFPDARVSTPVRWDEVDDCDPHDFTISTVPGALRRDRRPARRHRRPRLRPRAAARVGRPRRGRRPHLDHRPRRPDRRGGPMNRVVDLADKLGLFSEHWSPKVVARLNDYEIKLAKLKGEFVWHTHDDTDELFLVIEGTLIMQLRDAGAAADVTLAPGQLYVVPRGVEHCPIADGDVSVMLIEPAGVVNTGAAGGDLTATYDDSLL